MKDYYEKIYEIVEKRGEERIRQRKAVMVRRTRAVYSSAGLCAAMIVGFGIWHNNNIKQLANRESSEPEIITTTSETTEVPAKTTTSPTVTTHAASSTNKKATATVSSTQTTSSVKTIVETSWTAQTTAIESADSHEQLSETVTSAEISENGINAPDTEKDINHDSAESEELYHYSPGETDILDVLGFVMPYGESYYHSSKSRISDDRIGEFLGDINLNTVNLFKGLDEVISVSGKIYKITNISTDCALAVKYDTDGEYHLFSNINYLPETLGQMISDMDLKNEMEIVAAIVDGQAYAIHSEKVWEYLLSEGNAQSYENGIAPSDYEVVVNVPILGKVRVVIGVYDDGHISTNVSTGRAPSFDIGKENTDKFIEYVKQYGVPIELPPHPSNANANPDAAE